MKTKIITKVAVLGLMTTLANGANIRYQTSGDWTALSDGASAGWQGSIPGAADNARINWGGNTVTVSSSVATVTDVQIGVDESGILEVASGGVLTSSRDVIAGNNNVLATGALNVRNGGVVNVGRILWSGRTNSTGNITIDAGGQINVTSHLWLGVTTSSAISIGGVLNQTGGILGLGTSDAATASGGSATVTILNGGLMALNNISGGAGTPSILGGSVIDLIQGGLLTVPNDQIGTLNSYIAANKITGAGVTGGANLDVSYNSDSNLTTVSVVPEPSSALLLGLAGALGLFRRRK